MTREVWNQRQCSLYTSPRRRNNKEQDRLQPVATRRLSFQMTTPTESSEQLPRTTQISCTLQEQDLMLASEYTPRSDGNSEQHGEERAEGKRCVGDLGAFDPGVEESNFKEIEVDGTTVGLSECGNANSEETGDGGGDLEDFPGVVGGATGLGGMA